MVCPLHLTVLAFALGSWVSGARTVEIAACGVLAVPLLIVASVRFQNYYFEEKITR